MDGGFGANEHVDVVIRPEDIKVSAPSEAKLTGIVESTIFKGVHYEMIVDACDGKWKIQSTKAVEPGQEIGMRFDPEDLHIMKKMEEHRR